MSSELYCKICYTSGTLSRPKSSAKLLVKCPCVTDYCEGCLADWITTEIKNLNLVDKIEVRCPNHQ